MAKKKAIFILANSLWTQVFLKKKFLTAIVWTNHSLKDELTGLHKTLQKFIFYWN